MRRCSARPRTTRARRSRSHALDLPRRGDQRLQRLSGHRYERQRRPVRVAPDQGGHQAESRGVEDHRPLEDAKSSTVYSIAELDFKAVKTTLEGANGMNEDLKRYIGRNGENIFDKVSGEKK